MSANVLFYFSMSLIIIMLFVLCIAFPAWVFLDIICGDGSKDKICEIVENKFDEIKKNIVKHISKKRSLSKKIKILEQSFRNDYIPCYNSSLYSLKSLYLKLIQVKKSKYSKVPGLNVDYYINSIIFTLDVLLDGNWNSKTLKKDIESYLSKDTSELLKFREFVETLRNETAPITTEVERLEQIEKDKFEKEKQIRLDKINEIKLNILDQQISANKNHAKNMVELANLKSDDISIDINAEDDDNEFVEELDSNIRTRTIMDTCIVINNKARLSHLPIRKIWSISITNDYGSIGVYGGYGNQRLAFYHGDYINLDFKQVIKEPKAHQFSVEGCNIVFNEKNGIKGKIYVTYDIVDKRFIDKTSTINENIN